MKFSPLYGIIELSMDGGIAMYFIDRNKIRELLAYIDVLFERTKNQKFASELEKLSLERIVHMQIEAMLDVGNMMIDGFIMRDPGSYEDIIDILVDERVIPAGDSDTYKEFIRLRQMVVQEYTQVDHTQLAQVLTDYRDRLSQFSTHITTYLDNELGVAHAFSNE